MSQCAPSTTIKKKTNKKALEENIEEKLLEIDPGSWMILKLQARK
jgi:hypothetical protein